MLINILDIGCVFGSINFQIPSDLHRLIVDSDKERARTYSLRSESFLSLSMIIILILPPNIFDNLSAKNCEVIPLPTIITSE